MGNILNKYRRFMWWLASELKIYFRYLFDFLEFELLPGVHIGVRQLGMNIAACNAQILGSEWGYPVYSSRKNEHC